jgi:hypothetical protein
MRADQSTCIEDPAHDLYTITHSGLDSLVSSLAARPLPMHGSFAVIACDQP